MPGVWLWGLCCSLLLLVSVTSFRSSLPVPSSAHRRQPHSSAGQLWFSFAKPRLFSSNPGRCQAGSLPEAEAALFLAHPTPVVAVVVVCFPARSDGRLNTNSARTNATNAPRTHPNLSGGARRCAEPASRWRHSARPAALGGERGGME